MAFDPCPILVDCFTSRSLQGAGLLTQNNSLTSTHRLGRPRSPRARCPLGTCWQQLTFF